MAEESRVGFPTLTALGRKISTKLVLKWLLFIFLVVLLILLAITFFFDLKEINELEQHLQKDKEAADDIREFRLTVWSDSWLYFTWILIAIYAVVKEKYPLLLSFAIMNMVIMCIYIFDYVGALDLLLDAGVTTLSFVCAIYFRYEQNIPWNPL